jgi:hypothetical protein
MRSHNSSSSSSIGQPQVWHLLTAALTLQCRQTASGPSQQALLQQLQQQLLLEVKTTLCRHMGSSCAAAAMGLLLLVLVLVRPGVKALLAVRCCLLLGRR